MTTIQNYLDEIIALAAKELNKNKDTEIIRLIEQALPPAHIRPAHAIVRGNGTRH